MNESFPGQVLHSKGYLLGKLEQELRQLRCGQLSRAVYMHERERMLSFCILNLFGACLLGSHCKQVLAQVSLINQFHH